MERNTISRRWQIRFVVLGLMALSLATVPGAVAIESDPGRLNADRDKPGIFIEAKVESRTDGVYILISVRQTVAGSNQAESSNRPILSPGGDQSHLTGNSNNDRTSSITEARGRSTAGTARPGRSWTDVTGYHYETPSGQLVTLTPPNISTATRESWIAQLQQHQNENPYLMYVDQQFNGVVWVPRTTGSASVQLGPAPAPPAPQPGLPGGNANSTDPREVALDALGHQPLPNAQIRMNPGLGLVAMPAWFWVEGYDGSSFGTSRTVEIPPEVGPEVPATAVPANDPRRRGSSFTVEVRLWPTSYAWSFGDGATAVSVTLGRPYPAQSDIQHTYEFSSLLHPTGFPVRLTVDFAAEFRVNGGAPEALPTIQRTYETGYRVQEVQPVLTSR